MSYTAEIISVGTELLLGNVVNSDAKDISQMLSELGINVYFHTVVGDNPERLKSAVSIAKSRADIIITTGGLGPTFDDLTKQTLAEAFGKKLIYSEEDAEAIKAYFEKYLKNCSITKNNFQQAYLPEGCTPFHNAWGTAPGCAFEAEGKRVLMLPGPPRECIAMFKHCALPYLKCLSNDEIHSHNIHIFGMGESAVEDKLHDMMTDMKNPTLAPYAKEGECMLRLTAKAPNKEEAEKLMAPVLEKVKDILGDVIYSVDVETLERTVLELLIKDGKTLATAESCTGGLVSSRITSIPGASAAYLGGVATYSNDAKCTLINVNPDTLASQGAVCRDVAVQMAHGIRERLGADIAIGITGIAGPASDDTNKPVGLVYVALADSDNAYCRELNLGNARNRIRTSAANHAFDMIRRYLTGIEIEKFR